MSRVTNKTRATDKGTEYPPLPMSVQGDSNIWSPTSQTSRLPKSPSKAPSVSPSDSPSQAKYKSPIRSPIHKLKSIPSEDGAGGESLKRGNGIGESLHFLEGFMYKIEFAIPRVSCPLTSKPTVLTLQTCPNDWRHVCYCGRWWGCNLTS